DAMVERALALEIQHGVHDVPERLRLRGATALRNVSHEQHRGSSLLRQAHEARRAFADLSYVARGAFEVVGVGGLNRVHEHDLRAEGARVMDDRLEPGLAQ